MRREYKQEGLLPSGYRQLEYLQSTGTQHIVTGLSNFNKYTTIIDYKSNGGYGVVCGSWNSWQGRVYYLRLMTASSGTISYGSSGSYETALNIDASIRHIYKTYFEGGCHKMDVDGINKLSFALGDSPTNERILWLFGNNSTTNKDEVSGILYSCQFYNDNNIMIRNFIPALRKSDSKPGLYDIVNNVFYTNQGTGEFLYA